MDDVKREIRQMLLGNLVPDGKFLAVSPNKLQSMRFGMADGADMVLMFGISKRTKYYTTDKSMGKVRDSVHKAMMDIGRKVKMTSNPKAEAVICRYLITRPIVVLYDVDEVGIKLETYTARGVLGLLSELWIRFRLNRLLPEDLLKEINKDAVKSKIKEIEDRKQKEREAEKKKQEELEKAKKKKAEELEKAKKKKKAEEEKGRKKQAGAAAGAVAVAGNKKDKIKGKPEKEKDFLPEDETVEGEEFFEEDLPDEDLEDLEILREYDKKKKAKLEKENKKDKKKNRRDKKKHAEEDDEYLDDEVYEYSDDEEYSGEEAEADGEFDEEYEAYEEDEEYSETVEESYEEVRTAEDRIEVAPISEDLLGQAAKSQLHKKEKEEALAERAEEPEGDEDSEYEDEYGYENNEDVERIDYEYLNSLTHDEKEADKVPMEKVVTKPVQRNRDEKDEKDSADELAEKITELLQASGNGVADKAEVEAMIASAVAKVMAEKMMEGNNNSNMTPSPNLSGSGNPEEEEEDEKKTPPPNVTYEMMYADKARLEAEEREKRKRRERE